MNTHALLRGLAKFYPKKIAKKHHDFVGLMCGKLKEDTNRILLCLDFDETILNKVEVEKYDLIITHHPFIYGQKRYVLKFDEHKRRLFEKMLEIDVPIYSFHTNFDEGKKGMNDALASLLMLNNIYSPAEMPMMRIGTLSESMEVHEFAKYAIEKLNVPYGALIDEGKSTILKVGVIGGGGSRDYKIAKELGCDIYISGDVPHHVRRDIVIDKFNYLDVPHEVENVFMVQMKKTLLDLDDQLIIDTIVHEVPPKIYKLSK